MLNPVLSFQIQCSWNWKEASLHDYLFCWRK